jgi:hypothetical protein
MKMKVTENPFLDKIRSILLPPNWWSQKAKATRSGEKVNVSFCTLLH